jgi:hypothetical protein
MIFHTRKGQIVLLKAHLLQHAFATHAVLRICRLLLIRVSADWSSGQHF